MTSPEKDSRAAVASKADKSIQADSIRIDWDAITVREWRALLRKAGQSNLLQSWPYAQSVLMTERLRAHFATVHYQGRIIGICQVLEQRLLGLFHKVRLYRGPLWLYPDLPEAVEEAFLRELRQRYPRRPWRNNYFLFEKADSEDTRTLLERCGFQAADTNGKDRYSSIWLDLRQEEESLRAGLKGKWRNALNQSEKSSLSLDVDQSGKSLPWLLQLSEMEKALKEFRGPSPALVAHLCRYTKERKDFLLLRAMEGETPVGAVLLFIHEDAATYLVGWNSPAGRRLRAHNYLLWQAILLLKKRRVKWLDLGGINEESAAGVTAFKRGLNGEEYTLVGAYR